VTDGVWFSNSTNTALQTLTFGSATPQSAILQGASSAGFLGTLNPATASLVSSQSTFGSSGGTNISILTLPEYVETLNATIVNLNLSAAPATLPVSIMIKPTAPAPVPINAGSQGDTPVAILSTANFNATTQVRRSGLTFGATGNEASFLWCDPGGIDVNGDGLPDLMCHFSTPLEAFGSANTRAYLRGMTVSGTPIQGSEAIVIVP
jgi:hypothetical protein